MGQSKWGRDVKIQMVDDKVKNKSKFTLRDDRNQKLIRTGIEPAPTVLHS